MRCVVARRSGSSCPGSGGAARPRPARSPRRRARTARPAERAHDLDDLGQARGDVVEVAGEHAHLVAARGAPGCGRRRASTRPTPGPVAASASATSAAVAASIGCTGRSTSRPTASSAAAPAGERRAGAVGRGRRRAWRPAHDGGRHRRRPGDRVGHHARERALPQLAGEQAQDEVGLGRGRLRQQVAQDRGAPGRRPRAGRGRELSSAASSSATVRLGSAAGVDSSRATVAHPMPMRPWRGSPVSKPTTGSTSSAPGARAPPRAPRPSPCANWSRWPRRRRRRPRPAGCRDRSVATRDPLVEVRGLVADRGVVAVAGVHDGVGRAA